MQRQMPGLFLAVRQDASFFAAHTPTGGAWHEACPLPQQYGREHDTARARKTPHAPVVQPWLAPVALRSRFVDAGCFRS